MKQSTKYVALDVHQAITVASVREASGRVLARAMIPTEVNRDLLLDAYPDPHETQVPDHRTS